ncbi:S8 family peptidase [Peijinzhouia sedimentorum]
MNIIIPFLSRRAIASLLVLFIFSLQPIAFQGYSQSAGPKPAKNWFHLDPEVNGPKGISTQKAYEFVSDRGSRKIIVAVIDSGIDTNHPDLNSKIWTNDGEEAGTKQDNDGNGYVDDIHGWSFLGNPSGENIDKETMEVTREYRRLDLKFGSRDEFSITAGERDEWAYFQEVRNQYFEEKEEYEAQFAQISQIYNSYMTAEDTIKSTFGLKEINLSALDALDMKDNPALLQARAYLKLIDDNGIAKSDLVDAYEQIDGILNYGFNTEFNPRNIVESNYYNFENTTYGNSDVQGPDARHGTHVAGIIGAVRDNNTDLQGVADNVEIMVIRAVPDGDEYDKDVANAIRYAVDNGAHIINMSFGKSLSPQKFLVDEAVKYAEKNGVLLIHAAGNDGVNIDTTENYPTSQYSHTSKVAKNWIEVGASSYGGADNFVGNFSNYGKKRVDIFAPGVDIYSSTPDGQYEYLNGTSMAAPVVTGVAAMLMAYFPKMKAKHVKKVIMESSMKYPDQRIKRPGSEETDPMIEFSELSVSGGIINAFEAVKMANKKWGKRGRIPLDEKTLN